MSTVQLPPFPVDDGTLDMLMAALDPWGHGDPDAPRSSLWDFLGLMSELAGSDTAAYADEPDSDDPSVRTLRDPQYTDHCVIAALVDEVRRLRAELASR